MLKRIEKTALATQDIERLSAFYLAKSGIRAALRFVDDAEHAFVRLARTPGMGVLLGFPHPPYDGIRRWHLKRFPRALILYRECTDGIEVVRLFDGGRDLRALFDDAGLPSP
jgi:toxin ParE1/3/4